MIEAEAYRRYLPFLPAAIVVAAWIVWAHFDGGYFAATWYPSAIAAVGLLVATAVGIGRIFPPAASARLALAGLAGLVAWSFLSLAWSGSPGTGWDAANKLVLYLAIAWTVSLLPWTARASRIALGAWAIGIAAVCAISLIGASAGPLADYFIEGRYLDPIGYSNGVSALPLMALFPALWLCSRAEAGPGQRALFLAVAVFLVCFSLLPQSRAAVIGAAVAIPVFIAVFPNRLRLFPPAAVVGAAVLFTVGPIYDVYSVGIDLAQASEAGRTPPGLDLGATLDEAIQVIAIATALAAFAGLVWGLLERAASPGEVVVRRTRLGVGAAFGLALLVAVLIAAVNAGSIATEVDDRWQTFKSGENTPATDGARLAVSESDQRYDYWRVAVEQFQRTPAVGAGVGSYEAIYSAERRHDKPSKYPHDLWLRLLSEGGLVALALLVLFLGASAVGLVFAWRRLDLSGRGLIAACAATSAYFFVHASFDWLEEFPALAAPAFSLPLIGIALTAGAGPRLRRSSAYAVAGMGGVLALAAVGSLVFPYLAHRHLDRGAEIGLADVALAREELGRAADLNPVSPAPLLRAGTILVAAGDLSGARAEFRRALEREDVWYAHFELALIAAEEGRKGRARRQLAQASELNRHDPYLAEAQTKIRRGLGIDASAFNMHIQESESQRFTRPRG